MVGTNGRDRGETTFFDHLHAIARTTYLLSASSSKRSFRKLLRKLTTLVGVTSFFCEYFLLASGIGGGGGIGCGDDGGGGGGGGAHEREKSVERLRFRANIHLTGLFGPLATHGMPFFVFPLLNDTPL